MAARLNGASVPLSRQLSWMLAQHSTGLNYYGNLLQPHRFVLQPWGPRCSESEAQLQRLDSQRVGSTSRL